MEKQKKEKVKVSTKQRGVGLHGIKVRLLCGFMVPVICLVLLGSISYSKASEIVVENAKNDMEQTVYMMSEYYKSSLEFIITKIDGFYSDTTDYAKGLYNTSDTASIQFYNSTQKSLKRVLWADANMNNVGVVIKKDQSILANGHVSDTMYDDFLATREGQIVTSDRRTYHWFGQNPELDAILGEEEGSYVYRCAMAFINEDAILFAEVKESLISSIMESLDFGEGSLMGMVSADGTEVAYVNGESIINGGYFLDYAYPKDGAAVVEMTDTEQVDEDSETKNTTQTRYVKYQGKSYLYLESEVMSDELKVCVLVPESVLLKSTEVIRTITIAMVVIACVLALAIGIALSNNISKVIAKVNKHLGKIAQGDLTSRLKMKGKDEFAVLANVVNHMTDNVSALVKEVHVVGASLVEDVEEVAAATEQFVDSTDSIKNSTKEIEEGVGLLDENATDSLSQMTILSSKFTQVNENTAGIGNAVDRTVEAINDGMVIMKELNDKTAETTEMMNAVSRTMELLQKRIADIDSIVNAIDEIAEETTLLSLNASIEAARAGEAGRGFSVVADEIRKLADQSLVSAGEIRKIIQEITEQTVIAGESVGNACESVENQKEAVGKTTASFTMMDEQTRVLMTQVGEILDVIQSMEEARSTTEDAIQSISSVAEQTFASASDVYNATEAQAGKAVTLKQTSQQMSDCAAKLTQAIQKFTVED